MDGDQSISRDLEANLRAVMADVLGVDAAEIDDGFARDVAPDWDSLNHLRLVTALEEGFGCAFTMAEVEAMVNFRVVRECVATQLQRP